MLPCSTSRVIAKEMGKIFEMTAAVPESICNRPIRVLRGLRHARAWLTRGGRCDERKCRSGACGPYAALLKVCRVDPDRNEPQGGLVTAQP
jgi:hypothetical protein